MSDAKKEQSEHERAVEELREILKPGDTVYTILRHVSRSGMTRFIDVYVFRGCEPRYLSGWVGEVLGWKTTYKYHGGIKVGGCGMDMGFHLVYSLSRHLFPNGFGEKCIKPDCNYRPESKEKAALWHTEQLKGVHEFRGRNGDTSGWDNDGGYALKQRWI